MLDKIRKMIQRVMAGILNNSGCSDCSVCTKCDNKSFYDTIIQYLEQEGEKQC